MHFGAEYSMRLSDEFVFLDNVRILPDVCPWVEILPLLDWELVAPFLDAPEEECPSDRSS